MFLCTRYHKESIMEDGDLILTVIVSILTGIIAGGIMAIQVRKIAKGIEQTQKNSAYDGICFYLEKIKDYLIDVERDELRRNDNIMLNERHVEELMIFTSHLQNYCEVGLRIKSDDLTKNINTFSLILTIPDISNEKGRVKISSLLKNIENIEKEINKEKINYKDHISNYLQFDLL